jgi:DNA-binding PadR family transcriptional regulator
VVRSKRGGHAIDDRRYTVKRYCWAVVDPRPLREPTFLVLVALGPGPLHGYGIIKAIEEMSDGRVRLRAGTLYAALDRLEDQGLVVFHGEGSDGGPARRYFRLTDAGRELLASEASRLQSNARLAFDRLGVEPS